MDENLKKLIESIIIDTNLITEWEQQSNLMLEEERNLKDGIVKLQNEMEGKLDDIFNKQFDSLLNENLKNYNTIKLKEINEKLKNMKISDEKVRQEMEKLIALTLRYKILEITIKQDENNLNKQPRNIPLFRNFFETETNYIKKLKHDEIKLVKKKTELQKANKEIEQLENNQKSLKTTIKELEDYINDIKLNILTEKENKLILIKNNLIELINNEAKLAKINEKITENNINRQKIVRELWKLFLNQFFSNNDNKNWQDYQNWIQEKVINKIKEFLNENPTWLAENKLQLETLKDIINSSYIDLHRDKKFLQAEIDNLTLKVEATIEMQLQLLKAEAKNKAEIDSLQSDIKTIKNRIIQFEELKNSENPKLIENSENPNIQEQWTEKTTEAEQQAAISKPPQTLQM